MASTSQLACVYASLLLHDGGVEEITAAKIHAVLEAANVKVEKYWPTFFARFLEKHDISEFLSAAAAPAPGAGPATSAAPVEEEKVEEEAPKEEEEEESDDDMGFGLFD
uniref:60S acidic ribosomal protein P1-2 n=1 Tax=Stygiella incarcerata TaxID=1712417 RepID=A0A192ZI21_9EUKA|nr:60S acidic ribosomal protein P1-2 [Stygiella incarcerata]|eukprot:TRINITY_DN1005_c0_g1_i2.p2 TRINITY_DN1005_c0_g1~~TRINITY_DN1005_c0_g1_i2.p2  ORF type:complete len:109 (-),score=41.32 TRINITY_DN1005_c0_g1_i2:69-395(-)